MNNIFSKSYGNGQVIVLLHGFCEDSRVWDAIVPSLAKQHKVITIDILGFGNSALDAAKEVNTLEYIASSIKEKLVVEGVDKCIMLGHSMGGYITLAFAEQYPQMLMGFGLFHSTANADTDFKKKNRLKHIAFVERNGVEPFVKTLIPSLFSAKHEYVPQMENSLQMAKECSVSGITNALQAMLNRPERKAILKQSKVPVLLIAGEEDTLVLAKDIALQASLPTQCQFELLRNSGHMGMLEEPEKSVEIINEFIALTTI